jgi:hypothetical protein
MTFGGYRKRKVEPSANSASRRHADGTLFPDDDAGIEDPKIHVASIYPYIMTVKRLPTC